jgi:ABC-2 type transport system permease protein
MKTIFHIFIREWKRILSIPAFYVLLLVLPPLVFTFFGIIYQKQYARDLPIAIWDEDHSAVSRQMTRMLEQSQSIHIVDQVLNGAELEHKLKKGQIYGAVHFPKDMEKTIKSNHEVNITLFTNSVAMVASKLIYKDAAKVIIMSGAGVTLQKQIKKGTEPQLAKTLVQPVALNTRTLYNPSYNYNDYLVPGLITVGLQMALIMAAVLLFNYEWKTNTMEELLTTGKGSAYKIIAGKTLAHLTCSWVNFVLIIGIVFPLFGLSQPQSNFNFFVLYTLLSIACIGLGFAVSVLFKDVMMASDIALFYTSPAFVFSGFTFPRWAMPWYDQFYANLMPYTAFLDGFLKTYFMHLSLRYTYREMAILGIFIGASFLVTTLVLQLKINKMQHVKVV